MHSVHLLLFTSTVVFGIVAYAFYFLHTKNGAIHPNRWSWLIWGIATMVETLTYNELSGDAVKSFAFFVSAACCFCVALLIWRKAIWQMPDWTEALCLVACIIALVLWVKYEMTWWAHLTMLISLPVAFIPTYRDAWRHPARETTPAWMLWTIGDALLLALVFARLEKAEELPYAFVELISHGLVWMIVSFRKGTH